MNAYPVEINDLDMDGIQDNQDNCPEVSNPDQTDADEDGIGDVCDSDLDGDGVENGDDDYPNDSSEHTDTDGDNIGDNADVDDDNDGSTIRMTFFPLDASETLDTDGDGIGNNADADDDGDGITDTMDNCQFVVNPDQSDADGDGIGTACDGDESSSSMERTGLITGFVATSLCLLAVALTPDDSIVYCILHRNRAFVISRITTLYVDYCRIQRSLENGDTEALDALVHEEFVFHPHVGGMTMGKSDIMQFAGSGHVTSRTIEFCLRTTKLVSLIQSFTLRMILIQRLSFLSCDSRMDRSSPWRQVQHLSLTTTSLLDKIEFSRCRSLGRSFDRVCLPRPSE